MARRLQLPDARALAARGLERSGASALQAEATGTALVAAEADGQAGHGLSRLPAYCAQLASGKVRGAAVPKVAHRSGAGAVVDADAGFAFPALEVAGAKALALAGTFGTAAVAIVNSHHAGQASQIPEALAEGGLVALLCANTPSAMAFHGGRRPRLGTNPLAFAAPLPGRAPLVIDLALSQVARSKVVAAAKEGRSLPPGWAYDAEGRATEDAAAALAGSLAPVGGAKGAALAMMVEVLCAALGGAAFGWEASSFLDAEGGPPRTGQFLLALDPLAFGGPGFLGRMGALAAVVAEDGGRLPGDRRLPARTRAQAEGLVLGDALAAEILDLAGVSAGGPEDPTGAA